MIPKSIPALLLLFGSIGGILCLQAGSETNPFGQLHAGLQAQSEPAAYDNIRGDRVLETIKTIIGLYDSVTRVKPASDEHGHVAVAKAAIASTSVATAAASTNATNASVPDVVNVPCSGPDYCCCATGCTTGCPHALSVAFPDLVQELAEPALVQIPCSGPTYCCCAKGCTTGCPHALMDLFPGLVQELSKSEL